jgi:putative membrane protein insertion efficiency factor
MSPLARLLALPIRGYRLFLSPWFGLSCRYQPTCSQYALDALERHGALRGGWLALWRIARCNPWGGCGYDPVPGCGCDGHDQNALSTPRDPCDRDAPNDTFTEMRNGNSRGTHL